MTAWAVEHGPLDGAFRFGLRMSKCLHHSVSEHQEILLFENELFGRVLTLDGIVQTTERDEFFYHEMLIHVPCFAHGAVERALIIGGGDGGALEELLKHDSVRQVTMVEIDAGVVEFSKEHLRAICGDAFEDPRLELVIADGAAWVAETDQRFDLIVIDSTDPSETGPSAVLFTADFYGACAAALNDDGVMVSQNSLPFSEPHALVQPFARLRGATGAAACYRVPVPSYIGGEMAITLAAKSAERLKTPRETLEKRFSKAAIETQYYSPAVHLGAFALPPYVARLLD